jgi:hypothetical protein
MDYLDFEIEIGQGQGREYPVSVIHSPAGEARETMRFPFDEQAAHVDQLPRQTEARFATLEELTLEMLSSVRLFDLTRLGREEGSDNLTDLLALLQKLEHSLLAFGRQITAHYLTMVPSTPHFSTMMPYSLP